MNSVWFDLEPSMAEAMMMNVRARVMTYLQNQIRERKWTQRRAAEELGISQPRVCHLMGDRIDRFSTDTLIVLLGRLGIDVTLSAKPRAAAKSKRTA